MSILVSMIDSAFAPIDSGVGSDYSSASVPVSSQPGVVPPAPPTVPPSYSNPSPQVRPKKSSKFFKLFGLGLLLVVLIGGLITAYFLSQQQQEIRQQASQADNYTQNPFTFQNVQSADLTFNRTGTSGPTQVRGTFNYPTNPSCDANMSCNAQVRFSISEITNDPAGPDLVCTTNTANLVHYKFLTKTTDSGYPGNLTTTNCNRPISQCGNDPQCTTTADVRMYGPSGCGDQCRNFEASLPFSITNTEYGCGCVQFDPNISELSLNCKRRDDTEYTTYRFTRDTTNDQGPWAYAYNTAQCSTPVSPSPTPTQTVQNSPTPTTTPTTPPGVSSPTPTKTPTPTVVASCNSVCRTNAECPSNLTCYFDISPVGSRTGHCRLPSNPTNLQCQPLPTATPTSPPGATATPTRTPTPTIVPSCNSVCRTNAECPSNLTCYFDISPVGSRTGHCRLPSNPTNLQCQPLPTATPTSPPGATATPTRTPTPTSPPGVPTATPTPTTRNTPTPTPTTPPFGGMCLSISSTPANPVFNDSVTFTCGLVQGVTRYEFRYYEPGSSTAILLQTNANNVSKAIKVNKAGTYIAQCRICPISTGSNLYCSDPNWGWDPIPTTN